MKKYQIAILFFAIGIFTVTFAGVYLFKQTGREQAEQKTAEPVQYETLKVFFSNELRDPQFLNCEITYPVERSISRISDNQKTGLAEYVYLALAELLDGPGEADKVNGYLTSINEGTRVRGIVIEGGRAIVDFDEKLNEGVAGSCRVMAIRSQITQTLKQFPEIEDVVITVNGESEGVLEP